MAPGPESSPWLRVLAAATGWRMRWRAWRQGGIDTVLSLLTPEEEQDLDLKRESARSESARDDVRLVAHPRSSGAELRVGSVSRIGSARRRSFGGKECCRPLPTRNRPHWIGSGLPAGHQRPDPGNRSRDPKRRARNSSSRDRRAAALDRPLRRSFGERQMTVSAVRRSLGQLLVRPLWALSRTANDEQRTARRLTPYN